MCFIKISKYYEKTCLKFVWKAKYRLDNLIKKYEIRFIIYKFLQVYKTNYIKDFILIIEYKWLKIDLPINIKKKIKFL